MEPQRLAGAEIGDRVQRVDGPGVDRAGIADDDRGKESRCPIGSDRPFEHVHPDPEAAVGRDLPELVRADAEQVHGLVDAGMHLVGGVDR